MISPIPDAQRQVKECAEHPVPRSEFSSSSPLGWATKHIVFAETPTAPFLLVSDSSLSSDAFKCFHHGGKTRTFPASGLPSSRGANPFRHFLQKPKRPERALLVFQKFSLTCTYLLEGTIQQPRNWLTCFLLFGFTNSKCNCYILIPKDRGLLRHCLTLAFIQAHTICCWLGPHRKEICDMCSTPECRIRKGYTNAERHLPYLRILGRVTLPALWSHPSPPPWQSAKHLERAYIKQQPGEMEEWKWRDPRGARNCGVTTKTELLKPQRHHQGKIKINHLVWGKGKGSAYSTSAPPTKAEAQLLILPFPFDLPLVSNVLARKSNWLSPSLLCSVCTPSF